MSNLLCAFACNENFSSQPHTLYHFSQSWFAFRAYTLINGTLSVNCSAIIWLRTLLFIAVYILQPLLCAREYAVQYPVEFSANTRELSSAMHSGRIQCKHSKDSASLRSALRFILAPIVPVEFRSKFETSASLCSTMRFILPSESNLDQTLQRFCLASLGYTIYFGFTLLRFARRTVYLDFNLRPNLEQKI